MSVTPTISHTFVRRIDVQPALSFLINKSDFYINTYGISITDDSKSSTTVSDGSFYILNKNTQPVYYGGIQVTGVRFRNENAYPSTNLTIIPTGGTSDSTYSYTNYIISFKGNSIGLLSIYSPINFSMSNGSILQPFQSVEFGATYTVLNVNKLGIQYYGYSKINPNRTYGIIDATFNINTYADKTYNTLLIENMTWVYLYEKENGLITI